MRALILSWEYPPLIEGGLARHVRKLAEGLAARGVDVHVLARGREEDPPEEVAGGVLVHRVRALGYNMVKLCLFVPSQLYFDIADEEGMLLWLELPMWLPNVTDRLRTQAPGEYHDILMQAHTHPSIVIYSLGCELGAAVDDKLLSDLNDILRTMTSGILACDNSGSGEAYGGLAFDFADFNDYHFYCDLHNFNPLLDHFRRDVGIQLELYRPEG